MASGVSGEFPLASDQTGRASKEIDVDGRGRGGAVPTAKLARINSIINPSQVGGS